jgi:isoleucyl-tRNA synthetase
MYTFGKTSHERRSGQTAMLTVVDGLARLLAPILSVTMDELWRTLPGERLPSVHMALFPLEDETAPIRDQALLDRFETLRWYRELVNAQLEARRLDKTITANLSGRVSLWVDGASSAELEPRLDSLATLFGVSAVDLHRLDGATSERPEGEEATRRFGQEERERRAVAVVTRADGVKCERCWRYVPAVEVSGEFAGLCPRCVTALTGDAAH